MKPVSALYTKLLADPNHVREVKASIAGVEYGQNGIKACSTYCDLVADFEIGSCKSRELELAIDPVGEIPRAAEIALLFRLTTGREVSEWVPGGVFYVDTRSFDEQSGWLILHGVDAMMKAEMVWWDPSEDAGEWPMRQQAAAADIARRMGVALDPRTRIGAGLVVEYPNDLTMREVLGYIAMSNAGNWTMSGDGKLLLTPLWGFPSETRFLVDSEDGGAILFGDVRIIV